MYDSGGGQLRYDPAAMSQTACALRAVTGSIDGAGRSAPACGNYGDATALVALVMSAFSDAGARVAAEATLLGDIVDTCSTGMAETDAQAAVDVLTNGVTP